MFSGVKDMQQVIKIAFHFNIFKEPANLVFCIQKPTSSNVTVEVNLQHFENE